MPKVTIVQVIYNSKKWIEPVFSAIFAQTFKDFNVVVVISGNEDKSKELLIEKFPFVEIVDPGYNIGFAAGHNLVFSSCDADFFQLVNPDMVMKPDYIERMLKVFEDERVGAATGKLYRISNDKFQISNQDTHVKILDTTGVVISKSGRATDRGQHEVDKGQYDLLTEVDAVSGAGCMYRKTVLEAVKCQITNNKFQKTLNSIPLALCPQFEFFDEDFHSYWEDVDLSWRMKNAGWKNIFVPSAVGFHGRTASSSRGGYFHFLDFVKHHKALPERIRQLNYQNHILMYIKNSKYFYPQFFVREFIMFWYILFFEISTFKVLPKMSRLVSRMFKKRKLIKAIIPLVHGRE